MKKPVLIVLIGPTGVGKTELSLSIAEKYHTSIISSDSRQLYKDLKIGTAAPTPDQLKRVPHYFVGTLELTDYYSAAQFEAEVLKKLEELFRTHPVVVMTGGSMMYVDAVCKGIDDIPTVDKETRELMLRRYESEGLEQLCAELRVLDPEYYRIVDLKNPKRVIHALEICYMTGKTYTSFRTRNTKERPFQNKHHPFQVSGGAYYGHFRCGLCFVGLALVDKLVDAVDHLRGHVDQAVKRVRCRRHDVEHAHIAVLDDQKAHRLDLDACAAAAADTVFVLLHRELRPAAGKGEADAGQRNERDVVRRRDRFADDSVRVHHFLDLAHGRSHDCTDFIIHC